jgi:hypothetical protein
MIQKPLCLSQVALLVPVRRRTTFMAIAVMAAALIAGVSTAAAAADSPPLIQLEPGLDAGCLVHRRPGAARRLRRPELSE